MVGETFTAINRPFVTRLERHLGRLATLSTNYIIHLAWATSLGPAICPAVPAPLRFVLKPLLREELLLTGGEHKLVPAILAYQCFVLESHEMNPLTLWIFANLKRLKHSIVKLYSSIRHLARVLRNITMFSTFFCRKSEVREIFPGGQSMPVVLRDTVGCF